MDLQATVAAIENQQRELETIAKGTVQDLNTVAGTERLAKWKALTTAVLKQHAGDRVAGQFAMVKPGRSFSPDLLEEFQDQVDTYRTALGAAMKAVRAQGASGSSA